MDESFWEAFCYYLVLDYDQLTGFWRTWFTMRGLARRFDMRLPQAPRIFVAVPLNEALCVGRRRMSIDSSMLSLESSVNDIDVRVEGSILDGGDRDSSSSSCDEMRRYSLPPRVRSTPDIGKGRQRRRRRISPRDSRHSSASSGSALDGGFFSSPDAGAAGDRALIDQMQAQLAQVQRDIAMLVQQQQQRYSGDVTASWDRSAVDCSFYPIMASSPAVAASKLVAPPPPCAPPPPPPPSTPIIWRSASTADKAARRGLHHSAQMADLLQEMARVQLRPVRLDGAGAIESAPNDFVFNPKLPLRSVTRHESIIADALRQRFKQFRMLPDDEMSAANSVSTDEWCDDDFNAGTGDQRSTPLAVAANTSNCNIGRTLLRRVDRSMLPAVVSQDLLDDVAIGC